MIGTLDTIILYYLIVTVGLGIFTGTYHVFKKKDLIVKMDPDYKYMHIVALPTIITHGIIYGAFQSRS